MRMSPATLRVLKALLSDPAGQHYGYALLKQTGIKSGSLYPILDRLETEGWIEGAWESEGVNGRPPRRFYTLTGLGVREAKLAQKKYRVAPSGRLRPIGGR